MILFYFKNKIKLDKQIEINLIQNIKEQKQLEELKITRALLDGEEHERQRISQELHDGVGGLFSTVKLNFSLWSENSNLEDKSDFNEILNQLDYSISELRRISENMSPASLINYGLIYSIDDLCAFFSAKKITIEFLPLNINEKIISQNSQLNIYRIIQELLTNVIKHSHAKKVFIQCSQSENLFLITVEDNGIGIGKYFNDKGHGIFNIRKRVDYMNGKMDIKSKDNLGTIINIELIINEK
ncbi:sensor histidine kinase [Chryseobacterium sp. MEBOG07]|uniref:sensor histidine kinase n=1 Tax=Chryseobacterium sp. MEBOG07 TaxID=2879939 RepID=UPI001F420C80|nr:sensor histidine kinase [Chryseobacterium sp. MEBOG07]UKB78303.1 sensor histidine kinase [Chryseobacterium sp. MEBOG07]